MKTSQKMTIELMRYAICGIPPEENLVDSITDDLLEEVYAIADDQDVAYIIGHALSELNLLHGETKNMFFKQQLATLYRYESIVHELESIVNLFEENAVAFIPLKGSVIRGYYPKPEMRTSCDIDILVHKSDLDRARELMEEHLKYSYNDKCGHDISFWTPSGIEVELHHTLFEHDFTEKEQLDKVWEYSTVSKGYSYQYEMDKAFFMFYHVVHMAKHIRTGGCGLRPFIDIVVLEEKFDYDKDKFNEFVDNAELTHFVEQIFNIAHVWFLNEKSTHVSELMADYIFTAGSYGCVENQVARTQRKKGSKIKSILSRIFISNKELGTMYPAVAKKPWLTPLYEVVRWGRIIFKDKARKQMAIIKYNVSISEEKKEKVAKLFEELNLE